ncbi:hypothetical protein RQ479_12270 [Mesorhizobium sp. ISC25]|uniref:hypothetical protein n=1 Tax=Mesorhizobium sp. ISC25 TaxID=3077335 RepID=UPI0035DE606B
MPKSFVDMVFSGFCLLRVQQTAPPQARGRIGQTPQSHVGTMGNFTHGRVGKDSREKVEGSRTQAKSLHRSGFSHFYLQMADMNLDEIGGLSVGFRPPSASSSGTVSSKMTDQTTSISLRRLDAMIVAWGEGRTGALSICGATATHGMCMEWREHTVLGQGAASYHVTMIVINSPFCRADFGLPLDWRERDFLFQARSNA